MNFIFSWGLVLNFKQGKKLTKKVFLKALKGEKTKTVPFWFMRQAGRYLPEYRDLRAKKGGFLAMAFDPVGWIDSIFNFDCGKIFRPVW